MSARRRSEHQPREVEVVVAERRALGHAPYDRTVAAACCDGGRARFLGLGLGLGLL
jgi:hypothetical protein